MNPNFNLFLNNFNFMPNQNLNNFNQNMPGINYNNFPNPNFMNNQFLMFQNMNNQINNNIINQNQINTNQIVHNFNFKNQNQKILVDKIIDFYQKNVKKYMNYFEPNQINKLLDNLDTNSPNLKEGNDIDDPMPYIKEKKKLIKFINHDFKIFNVKVPISIDKKTLYQIANLYKTFYRSKILLIYMNCILNNDESSIDSISDDDYVIIIEDIYYFDDSYLNSLTNKNVSNSITNVSIFINSVSNKVLQIEKGTKLSQLIKALLFYFGCNYNFFFENECFNVENNQKDIVIQNNVIDIKGYTICDCPVYGEKFLGKLFNLKIYTSDEKETQFTQYYEKINIGSLDSIKYFIKIVELQKGNKIQKLYFDGKEINFKEDRSLLSLGIKEDSALFIVFESK